MDIAVCIKQVADAAEAELELDGDDIDLDDLVLTLNEWDAFAIEAAVRIKERQGGTVTILTLGDDEAEDVLRRALAMGGDAAIRIDGDDFADSDAAGIARGLAATLADRPFDLILTGAQSADTGWGQVGPMLAELLGLPWATVAVHIGRPTRSRRSPCPGRR